MVKISSVSNVLMLSIPIQMRKKLKLKRGMFAYCHYRIKNDEILLTYTIMKDDGKTERNADRKAYNLAH